MPGVKVVVASDAVGAFGSIAVGRELAQEWVRRGAQVAIAPMAPGGESLAFALIDAGLAVPADGPDVCVRTSHATVVVPRSGSTDPWHESSLAAGHAVAGALRERRPLVAVDLTSVGAHDGGAGFLAALGATADADLRGGWRGLVGLSTLDLEPARQRLIGADLVGIVDAGDISLPLTSLRGVSSAKGRADGRPLSEMVAADRALEQLCALSGIDGLDPGAGAAWGAGHAVLALGGTLTTGPQLCARLCGLESTLSQADLLVSGCTSLDIGNYGGPVIRDLADVALRLQVPFVVGAGHIAVGARELRTVGIEAAYTLDASTLDALGASATGMATTWSW